MPAEQKVPKGIQRNAKSSEHDAGGVAGNRSQAQEGRSSSRKVDNEALLRKFSEDPAVIDMVQHMTGETSLASEISRQYQLTEVFLAAFELFFPRLALLYTLTQRRLLMRDSLFNSYFPDCPFAAQSLNVSDQVVAESHTDLKNLVFGICAVLPFGDFNFCRSGQLVLKEARLIIEVRRGDILFFPSGAVHHENIPCLSPIESRQSAIFYSAGGLFRWVKQGHRTQTGMSKQGQTRATSKALGAERWTNGWKLYCHIDEFRS